MANGRLNATAVTSTLTARIQTRAGATPTATTGVVLFMPTTDGDYSPLQLTADLAVTVPSTASLGVRANAVAFRVWLWLVNESGTPRIGVSQGGFPREGTVTVTKLDTTSDNAGIIYSNITPSSATLPVRLLGYLEWSSLGLVATGTWTVTNLSITKTFGPGVKKPGDIVAIWSAAVSTSSSTSSATAVDTTLTITYAHSSACNPVNILASGHLSSSTASGYGSSRIYKGATAIGNQVDWNTWAGGSNTGMMHGLDYPNITGGQTYVVKYWGTVTIAWNTFSVPQVITVQEVMA
jgi:hypothetical protein